MLLRVFMLLWRGAGLTLWPLLWIHPRARRHMWRVPFPTPGRTWIHAASLGEHRIVQALSPHLGPAWKTQSSWRTPVPGAFPAPLDLPMVIGPWLDRARPSRIVLIEGELWPGWIMAARRRSIPVTVVAARKGPGWSRWQRLRSIFESLMSDVEWIGAENTGPLKACADPPPTELSLPSGCVVAASVRRADVPHLRDAWEKVSEPRPLLLIAPRHLDLSEELMVTWLSDGAQRRTTLEALPQTGVVILDTLGELDGLLPQAHTVFIGGTFDGTVGGHDPTWAHRWGVHLVAGPERHGNATAWQDITAHTVVDGASLGRTFERLRQSPRGTPIPPGVQIQHLVDQLPTGVHQAERPHRPWLWPVTPIWSVLSSIQRHLYRPSKLPSPCVVVGGVVAGGAGRTPVTGWLAAQLPGSVVVSAGYRRKGHGRGIRHPGGGEDLGDELEMLHRRGRTVISSPDRIAAMHELGDDQTVIIDGGMSDRRLSQAFRIAVIDAERPTGGGPLPVGTQRLPWRILEQVDAIWLTHCTPQTPEPPLPSGKAIVRSRHVARAWLHRGRVHPLRAIHGEVDVAVGIAAPERFICMLLDLGLQIRSLKIVRDHGNLGYLKPGTVVTEKDAARLSPDADVWALQLDLKATGTEALMTAIAEHRA